MAEPLRLHRQQQQLEELSSASLRALTGDARLAWRQFELYRDERRLAMYAPHLRVAPERRSLPVLRGIADAQALRLRHSDPDLFRRTCPGEPIARLVFELMEQLRVETLIPPHLPGVRANIHARFMAWSGEVHQSGLTESTIGILLYTVVQMAWSRLNALPVMQETEDFVEVTRARTARKIGPALRGMREHRDDQAAFALHAAALAEIVADSIHEAREEEDDADSRIAKAGRALALLLDFDAPDPPPPPVAGTGDSRVLEEAGGQYRIFTTDFDVEVDAADQLRADLLKEYRVELDALVARQGVNRNRLSRLLMAALGSDWIDGRKGGEEEGLIDGRRLAGLVSSPLDRRIFTQERWVRRANCAISFLIDCSGSMKVHARPVAVLVDVLGRTMERLGASVEVLGFSTGAWNGGRAYRQWLRQGKPLRPGRLNELSHRVFKPADKSWRQGRAGIAALFKADLFREGVDGEALQWAAGRLLARDAARRILIVISDGCPMDSATQLVNDEHYLDTHLRQVVRRLEARHRMEVVGVGVGLDLGPFYRRNVAVELEDGLGNDVLYDIAHLLAPPRVQQRR
ncbi:MAG: cobalt chelatase [Castellaniella sp.]